MLEERVFEERWGFRLGDVIRFKDCSSLPSNLSICKVVKIFREEWLYQQYDGNKAKQGRNQVTLRHASGDTFDFHPDALAPFFEHADRLTALVLFGKEVESV